MKSQPTAVWPTGLPHRDALRVYHSQPFTLYRQYDADGVLLYVGVTDHLERRNAGHRSCSPWWPLVARIETELLPNYHEACRQERTLIQASAPLYNVVFAADREAAKARRRELQQAATA